MCSTTASTCSAAGRSASNGWAILAVTWLMPRVNRDLQRRMAARRERERRRPPAERRYRFATPETDLAADEAAFDAEQTAQEEVVTPPKRSRQARENAATSQAASLARGGVKAGTLPFSSFRSEYAYVVSDLRRVALVIGSLLLILILLYFILPH